MADHKFVLGQPVRLRSRVALLSKQAKTYVIAQTMPIEHGAVTYKIRSVSDNYDRIADECDLACLDEHELLGEDS
jgi:hypothetical protein